MREVFEAIVLALEQGERAALATVLSTTGSTPQVAGARLLMRATGELVGTVGGGAVEQRIRSELERRLKGAAAQTLHLDLGRDLGMSCGGSMDIFVEPLGPTPRLIIVGAGHVGQATAELARKVDFNVVVVDARVDQNTEARFPHCRRLVGDAKSAAEQLVPSADDWLLFVSHSHAVDAEALAVFARRPHRYLGLMGSKRKVYLMLERLLTGPDPLPPPALAHLYAPVGVPLGAETPQEIAVSIVAELIAIRRGETRPRAFDDGTLARLCAEGTCPPR
jgi:xanthine dehydrogenase accessory factor